MARAHRHFIPGYTWHITHRCHKREFLLKFAKDRHRWLQWLFEAKKRYGLGILDYTVTSNHVHLLVYDNEAFGRDTIPRSVQLVAGRIGQEYNQRKKRKGSFWEDRYHATAIEDGSHLLRCIVYIDMNMVRAGCVDHPEQWRHGGYNEIQFPRRKCVLIDYDSLWRLSGFADFESFQTAHRKWVAEAVAASLSQRELKWSESIAVGGESFVRAVKKKMRALASGRLVRTTADCKNFELKETLEDYNCVFAPEKGDIDVQNRHFWDKIDLISGC